LNQITHETEVNCSKTRTAVTFFLSGWFEVQYSDFRGNVLEILDSFIQELPLDYQNPLVAKIQNAVKSKLNPSLYLFEPSKEGKTKLEPGKFGFLDIKPRQIADQWTILDMRNFFADRTRRVHSTRRVPKLGTHAQKRCFVFSVGCFRNRPKRPNLKACRSNATICDGCLAIFRK